MKRFAFALAFLGGATAATAQTVTLESLRSARLAHPAELDAERRIDEARRALARSAGLLRDGATIGLVSGPRQSDSEGTSTDVALGVELPILFARPEQRQLAEALERAAPLLRQAARVEAELDLEVAFLDAWAAAEEARLRAAEVRAAGDWLAATRSRVENGAAPPYETTLVAGELQRAALELERARAAGLRARAELAAKAPSLAADGALAPPPDPAPIADRAPSVGVLLQAPAARAALGTAIAALSARAETAHWGLSADVAREGRDRLARVGLAYRFPPSGEAAAVAAERESASQAARRAAELEQAQWASRLAAARAVLSAPFDALTSDDIERAERALLLRVTEGKDRPSEILPLRRSLLEAQLAILAARRSRAQAAADTHALTLEFKP
jgi:hypothetical protein